MEETILVGKSVVRTDAAAKVRGGAVYGVDVRFGGMLAGKTLRAGIPHARIVHLDTSAASMVPGVRAIVTGRDCARRHGLFQKDQPALAVDRVRYAGEVVAAVAAEDEDAAQEAVERIAVDYEELPGVFDVMEAVAPGAPLIHPDQMSYERVPVAGLALNPVPDSNISYHFKLRRGDVDRAWPECDLVVEDTFSTPFVQYAHLEPHVTVALYDAAGVMTLWTSTMGPHTLRDMLADLLDLPQQRVRVITNMVGGGYGSKMYLRAINPAAALLAMKVPNRHVRIAFDREDEFLSCAGRLPTRTTIKTGVKQDGTLVARQSTIYWEKGAYADIGAVIVRNASYCSLGPYRIPHARIDGYLVYTNRQPGGGFRGLGIPQVSWAGEQQMDRVARELRMSPLALRRANLLGEGDVSVTGERMHRVGVGECLERVAAAIGYERPIERTAPSGARRGRGLACILKSTLTPTASFGWVKLNNDGSVDVITSAVEHGQGAHTVLAQIAAEELSVPLDRVRCVMPDTSVTPFDRSSTSSRTTFHVGLVVKEAAADVRHQLLDMAGAVIEAHPSDLEIRDGAVTVRGRARPRARLRAGHLPVLRRPGHRARQGRRQHQAPLRHDERRDGAVEPAVRLLDVRGHRHRGRGRPRHRTGRGHADGVRRRRGPGDQPPRLHPADRRRRHHGPRHGGDGGGRLRRRPHAEPDVPRLQAADDPRRAAHRRHHRRERARRGSLRSQGRRRVRAVPGAGRTRQRGVRRRRRAGEGPANPRREGLPGAPGPRMILRPFEYVESATVEDAVAALRDGGEDARVIAGGTALVPLMKHAVLRPSRLVSIAKIPGLADVAPAASGGLRIGGVATHWAVSHSSVVRARSPLLADACGRVASPTIRCMGTLGGNLCYGESASDPAPALLALRATVRLHGPDGGRAVPIAQFFTGFYATALGEAEVLTAIDVPALPAGARWRYLKWTPRAQEDKALVGLAAVLVMDGRRCRIARLGLGGVAASPVVLAGAERALEDRELDEAAIAGAADAAGAEVEPVDDLQGSAEYRRDMLRVWVRRVVTALAHGSAS